MRDTELKTQVTTFLEKQTKIHKTFPQIFTARETAEVVSGVTTRIGFISDDVIRELKARGVNISYLKTRSPRAIIINQKEHIHE